MSNTVKLTQTVDDRDMVESLRRTVGMLDKMERKLDSTGKKGQKAGADTKSGFEGALGTLSKFGSAITGVGTLVQGVQKLGQALLDEYESIKQARGEAHNVQMSVAQAKREAMANVGAEHNARMTATVLGISLKTGATQEDVYKVVGGAASFRGNLSIDDAFAASEVAARIDNSSADAMKPMAEGILTVQKVAGGSTEDNAGFQMRMKAAATMSSNKDFAENIATATADMVRMENSVEDSGAFLAYLTHASGDSTGKSTRTAALQLAKQLQLAAPHEKGVIAQLDAVRNSPAIAKRLLGSQIPREYDAQTRAAIMSGKMTTDKGELTSEAKFTAAFASLLIDENSRSELERTRSKLGTVRGAASELHAFEAGERSDPLLLNAREVRRAEARVVDQQISNPSATAARVDELYQTSLRNQGWGSMSQWWSLGDGPVPHLAQLTGSGVDDAELRANQLKYAATIHRKKGDEAGALDLEATAAQIEKIREVMALREEARGNREQQSPEALGELAVAVRELKQVNQENTDATRENTRVTRDGGRGPEAPASAGLGRRD